MAGSAWQHVRADEGARPDRVIPRSRVVIRRTNLPSLSCGSARERARPADAHSHPCPCPDVRDPADHGGGALFHGPRRRRQVPDAALPGAAAGLGALRGAGARDGAVAAAPEGSGSRTHAAARAASRSRGDPSLLVAVLLQRTQVPAAGRGHRDQLFDAGPRDRARGVLSRRADDALPDRARHRRHRRHVSDRATRFRDVPGGGAAGTGRRGVLRNVSDPDAQTGERGFARAPVLSRDRRDPDHDRCAAVVRRRGRALGGGCAAHRRDRFARDSGSFPVHPRVPARAGIGPDAVHVHAARLGDARRLARIRQFPRRLDACRHGGHRRKRSADRAARTAARQGPGCASQPPSIERGRCGRLGDAARRRGRPFPAHAEDT